MTMFILLSVWFAIIMFSSYHAVVNRDKIAQWVAGTYLWMLFVFLLGITMFS